MDKRRINPIVQNTNLVPKRLWKGISLKMLCTYPSGGNIKIQRIFEVPQA